ncbi:pentatricopeptide repeat-containing protein [Senna tora]|uniref:Pentatricopeptide repeat-containing protein n=1 Tax=Senna tora TaxID=362788 RepID=A0A834T415_9FABA|nr:pentatricopeptide repeat-containing protein [Senna tora]
MARKALCFLPHRLFSSTPPEIPTLYSFLQPSIFALKRNPSESPEPSKLPTSPPPSLSPDQVATLQNTLHKALISSDTDEAWKSFKTLTNNSTFPSKSITNCLITHLSSHGDIHNLKRSFASLVYIIEKNPKILDFETVHSMLDSLRCANLAAPAFALIKCMFKNRFLVPFNIWGGVLVEICRKNGNLAAFLPIFQENCRIASNEKLDFMKPDLAACNAALEGSCRDLESVSDAENVVEAMTLLGVRPDESSFGFLAYLYALKGLEEKIKELKFLMGGFGFSNKKEFYCNLIIGYVKSGNLASVESTILQSLKDGDANNSWSFGEETYCEVVKGYLQNGNIKGLANLIIEAQKLEPSDSTVDKSIGYGIVSACVNTGLSNKAHSILDEMNALGGSVGLGVHVPILKAYCKENQTAEATQLVMEISNSGLKLDVKTYDALVDSSMSGQDFQSAFALFRDMREARVSDLKASYLTIMTGLMENHRPELMAAFLDEVAEDPRIDVEKYFSVLMLWNEVKRKLSIDGQKGIKFDHSLVDAFLYAMVKGGFFDAVMEVVEKSTEMKIFVDKWRYKQAFMETHKKLKVAKLRKRNLRKMEALIAFKNWAGLNA